MNKLDRKTEVLWIAASQITLVGVNFFLLKLMTSRLSVESFGYYSLCMTVILFTRQVLYDPISTVVAKDCASSGQYLTEASRGFEIVRIFTSRLGYVFFLLGLLAWLSAYVMLDRSVEGVIVFTCFAYLFANGAQGIYFNVLNSIRNRKSAALFSMLDSALKLMLVFLAFQFFGNQLIHAMMPVAVGALAVSLGVRRYIRTAFPAGGFPNASFNRLLKRSFTLSLPLYFPTLLGAFKSVSERWILAAVIGVDELAAFSVLLQIGYFPMLLVAGVAQTFVAPKMYALSADKSQFGQYEFKKFLYKLLSSIAVLAIISCVVTIYFSNYILLLLAGKVYNVFSIYLPYFVIAGAFSAAGSMLHLAVIGMFETRVVGKLIGVSVLIGIVCVFLLIVAWGFVGAIAGLVIASATTALVYWLALYFFSFKFVQDIS